MTLDDIFERIRLRSGHFLMNKAKIEVDPDRFALLIEDALAVYSKYSPVEKRFMLSINDNRTHVFTADSDNGIPAWISECVNSRFTSQPFQAYMFRQQIDNYNSDLVIPRETPWEYRRPNLTLPHQGDWQILAIYYHELREVEQSDGEIKKVVDTISIQDQDFFKLLQAKFMQGLGRSRRAFTMNDLPIQMDASELASEGNTLEDAAMESIKQNAKFYLAYGG